MKKTLATLLLVLPYTAYSMHLDEANSRDAGIQTKKMDSTLELKSLAMLERQAHLILARHRSLHSLLEIKVQPSGEEVDNFYAEMENLTSLWQELHPFVDQTQGKQKETYNIDARLMRVSQIIAKLHGN